MSDGKMKYDVDARVKLLWLKPEELEAHPANFPGRVDGDAGANGDFNELAESIAQHGVMQPLTVRELEEGRWQVLAGHRRQAACLHLQAGQRPEDWPEWVPRKLPCVVRPMDDRAALEFVLRENLERRNLDPLDEAHAVRLLLAEYEDDLDEVVHVLGRTEHWVKLRQGLLDLGEETREAVRRRRVSLGAVEAVLAAPVEERERAEQLVLHPDFQVDPLNGRQAAEVIRETILEPARLRKLWERDLKQRVAVVKAELKEDLGIERASGLNVMGVPWEDGGDLRSNSDFVPARQSITGLRQSEKCPEDLRWADLARRHGLAVQVVFDGEAANGVLSYLDVVNKRLCLEAEKAFEEHGEGAWLLQKPVSRPPDEGEGDADGPDAPADEDGREPELDVEFKEDAEDVEMDQPSGGQVMSAEDLVAGVIWKLASAGKSMEDMRLVALSIQVPELWGRLKKLPDKKVEDLVAVNEDAKEEFGA